MKKNMSLDCPCKGTVHCTGSLKSAQREEERTIVHKSSVAESEPVEPKLFQIWSRSRNYRLIHIYCSECGGCQDKKSNLPPQRHISYGTSTNNYSTVRWQHLAGAGAKIRGKGELESTINFCSATCTERVIVCGFFTNFSFLY